MSNKFEKGDKVIVTKDGDWYQAKSPKSEDWLKEGEILTIIRDYSSGDDILYERYNGNNHFYPRKFVKLFTENTTSSSSCKCDKFILVNAGCKCGAFQRELEKEF